MKVLKIDAASLGLLGDSNWLSIVSLFDLAGHQHTQFMLDQATPLAQKRSSRYMRHLHDNYISTYLKFYGDDLSDITVRCIIQAEDCPRNIHSVGWQSQLNWANICLIPDPYYFLERGYEDFLPAEATLPPWSARRPAVFWRGSTTGVVDGADAHANGFGMGTLDRLPRYRMSRILQGCAANADVGIVAIVQCPDGERDAIAGRLSAEGLMAPYIPPQDMANYKFLIDIDGNANSWNMIQRLRLGCCILKVESPWIQWISERLEPWVHYVPVKADLGDLLEKVEWCQAHDREAEQIADNGRRFGLSVRYDTEMQQAALDILNSSTVLSGKAEDNVALQRLCAAHDKLRPLWNASYGTGASFPDPMWLKTAHDTILGTGDDGKLIQHAMDGGLPNTITLFDGNNRWREQLRGYHIDRTGDTLRIERAGLFLSAHHDRISVACDRVEEGEWENFTLIPARR